MPVDLSFEWKAIKGAKAKQPYAIGMADGSAFGLAGLWENWRDPATDAWIRTFAVLTTEANGRSWPKPSSRNRASFIPGRAYASPSNTRGGSRVPESGLLGSVRGAPSNGRPYRD